MNKPLPYRGPDVDVARSIDVSDRRLRNSVAALDWRDRSERHVALLQRIAEDGDSDIIRQHGSRLLAIYEDVMRHPPQAERDYWRAVEAWVRANPNHPMWATA